MTHDQIPGWCDFEDAYREVVDHFPGGTLVECGCYLGRSLAYLAGLVKASGKPFRVVGVDHCLGSGVEHPAGDDPTDHHAAAVAAGGGTMIGTLHQNLIACGVADIVTLAVAPSTRAAELFADASLTCVFLDAGHDEPSVRADIAAWLPKVAPHGWLGGDDYGREGHPVVWPGVGAAVRAVLPDATPWSWDSWRWVKPG